MVNIMALISSIKPETECPKEIHRNDEQKYEGNLRGKRTKKVRVAV